ncbi:hypothetical protein K458DRAFT_479957 [Lentithecium fluviatile CBS 122367]|uniref:DUF4185 domain-containing protein n=1 Tax=Lentithecium fluviatile CBS 122367 TaxID=1168545 RepID=A0A6G1IQA4_9PLEO|nr:hypothetical protein K458DRAFT_479957 [Lentithecium fluviatile CBS 122367]
MPRLAWPPTLLGSPRVLDEITEISGRHYPRDFGRSIQLGGHTYYMFGDTFCFDDSREFVGVTNNCITFVPDLRNPTKSQFLSSDAKVPDFVPYSEKEVAFCERHENKEWNKRLVNWAFGGVIDIPGTEGREAWLFYDQVETHGAMIATQNGVGVAKVKVTGPGAQIECERIGPFPLFAADGPLWGNISNISAPDGWTYLLSGMGLDNFMARIRTYADFTKLENYRFLKKSGEWVASYSGPHGPFGELAHDVLAGQGQGAIVYLPGFAPEGRPYIWVGCEKFPTSQLCVGVAARPEGPWDVHRLGEMPKITEQAKTRYCIYPHFWGSDLEKGEILISWSDDGTMGGKVALARFRFAVQHNGD